MKNISLAGTVNNNKFIIYASYKCSVTPKKQLCFKINFIKQVSERLPIEISAKRCLCMGKITAVEVITYFKRKICFNFKAQLRDSPTYRVFMVFFCKKYRLPFKRIFSGSLFNDFFNNPYQVYNKIKFNNDICSTES